jgi:branched-subunit amino acid ABC-type transport system permease component
MMATLLIFFSFASAAIGGLGSLTGAVVGTCRLG